MISIEEAVASVVANSTALPPRSVSLMESLGCHLAECIASPIDSPPFDKALMDGYAVRAADITTAQTSLDVIDQQMAGDVVHRTVGPGQAIRIMTGSPIPPGADTIVVLEHTETGDGSVIIQEHPVVADRHILRRGTCIRKNQVVLQEGDLLTPGRIGLLAEIGHDPVRVVPPPTVSILATGNELVPPSETPAAGQIRNSNGPMLQAMVQQWGGSPVDLGIGPDHPGKLGQLISSGLESDILILSGGVSAGDRDLVPALLRENGVVQEFHKVQLKPGKPLWFGTCGSTLVFGLPGNPVSSFVCFQLFVRLAMRRMKMDRLEDIPFEYGVLQSESPPGKRTTFFPGRVAWEPDRQPQVKLLRWHGSADLRTLADADCLVELPAGRQLAVGDSVRIVPLLGFDGPNSGGK